MITIREIITEAMSRANIVPRRQAIPGAMLENGFRLLKAITARYNKDNLLNFTQDEYTTNFKSNKVHIYDKEQNILPARLNFVESVEDVPPCTSAMFENDIIYFIIEDDTFKFYLATMKEEEGKAPEYYWRVTTSMNIAGLTPYERQKLDTFKTMDNIQLPSVDRVNALFMNGTSGTEYSMIKLNYVPYEDWSKYYTNELVWSWVEYAEGEFMIYIKPSYVNRQFRIVFNKGIDFTIDSELRIPDNYVELLIAGLTHKLALQYPRLDNAQMDRLAMDLKAAQDNVKTPKAEMKMVLRNDRSILGVDASVIASGSFLWRD